MASFMYLSTSAKMFTLKTRPAQAINQRKSSDGAEKHSRKSCCCSKLENDLRIELRKRMSSNGKA